MSAVPSRVMVAMSGGVDSSVAALLLADAGYDVVGVTMKLWGGESDSGCCSVSDVDDARRVADHLGIEHHTFNFGDDFERQVVEPYVEAHRAGLTPNPCIECNRHLKFDRLLRRAEALGFDAVATGHHARIVSRGDGSKRVVRGADPRKDQSYVLHMLDQRALATVLLPVGDLTKAEVRAIAAQRGLRTSSKPDSQDVCFITSTSGRAGFLAERTAFTPGRVVDRSGQEIGSVTAVELVTIGQRRGLRLAGGATPRFVVDVDTASATVTVGERADLDVSTTRVGQLGWADRPSWGEVQVQCSAHGEPAPAELIPDPRDADTATVRWADPHRRVAPGQSIVFYEGDEVSGGGVAL